MAAFLLVVLLAGTVSGLSIRRTRSADGSVAGAGSGAFSSASSSSFSSSSGTKMVPGPGGYGSFNAFSGMSNMGAPQSGSDSQPFYRGGVAAGATSGQPSYPGFQGAQSAGFQGAQGAGFQGAQGAGFQGPQSAGYQGAGGFPGFPGYNPFVPQYGQQYPWVPFPNFAAPFDFTTFLNQYFQALQNFQAQAEAQAQHAAAAGHGTYQKFPGGAVWTYTYPRSPLVGWVSGGGPPVETNEVGGVGGLATVTYGPQGGYGNANIFPKPEGGLETRFGTDDETPQNSLGGGPVSSVSGNFKPPGGTSFGVFTSSSSGSSDINGKKTSFKQSSIGVNDNGKVTTYTSHDP